MIRALIHVLFFLKKRNNALTAYSQDGSEVSGSKRAVIGDSFDITDLKTLAKQNGATFNDVMMAILSVSMYKYFESKGKIEDEITLGLPTSFKKLAKTAETLELDNSLSPLFFELRLTEDFTAALDDIKTQTAAMRNSFRPYGFFYLSKVMA